MEFGEVNLVHCGDPTRTLNLVKRAVRMGYDSVAININIGDFAHQTTSSVKESQPPKKKKKTGDEIESPIVKNDFIPDPFLIDLSKLDLSRLEQSGKKFKQFSRLTATLSNSTSVHKLMHHPKIKLYDIIAVKFEDESILTTLTRKGDVIDLISIDGDSSKIPWLFKQKLVQACITAGISFEVAFSKALICSDNRRQFFTNARMLMNATKGGRNVILSSAAEDIISIRAPFDVANLCSLFGVDPRHGRKFVAANVKTMLLRSQSRQTIKGAVHVTSDFTKIPCSDDKKPDERLQELLKIPEFKDEIKETV